MAVIPLVQGVQASSTLGIQLAQEQQKAEQAQQQAQAEQAQQIKNVSPSEAVELRMKAIEAGKDVEYTNWDKHSRPTEFVMPDGQVYKISHGTFRETGTPVKDVGVGTTRSGAIDRPEKASEIFAEQVKAAQAREKSFYEQKAISETTTPEEAASIAKMLTSETAQFAPGATQKGYDIVQFYKPEFKPEQVKAGEISAISTPQIAAEKAIVEKYGEALPTLDLSKLSSSETQNLVDLGLFQYEKSPADTSFLMEGFFPKSSLEKVSIDISQKNLEDAVFGRPKPISDKPQYTLEQINKDWRKIIFEGSPGLDQIVYPLESIAARSFYSSKNGNLEYIPRSTNPFSLRNVAEDVFKGEKYLYSTIRGEPATFVGSSYLLGGVFAGGSALIRTGLSGLSKESGAFISFAERKLLPESIRQNIAILASAERSTLTTQEKLALTASKTPTLIPSTFVTTEKFTEPTITAGALGYIGYDIAQSKDAGEAFGKIGILAASYPFAKAGYEAGMKGVSKVQTFGLPRTEENILNPRVEAGKETFPTTRAGSFEKFKEEFKTPEGELKVFHATPEGFGKEGFTVRGMNPKELRKSDVPGLYVSPFEQKASTAFLRLPGGEGGKAESSLKSFLSSAPLKPEIYQIGEISGLKRIRGGRDVEKSREFLYSEKPELGTAYIEPKMEMGGFRGEAQAVLPQGTQISSPVKTQKVSVKGYDVKYTQRKILTKETSTFEEGVDNVISGERPDSLFSYRLFGEIPSSRPLSSIRIPTSSKEVKSSNFVISSKITPSSRALVSSKVVVSSKAIPSSKVVSSFVESSSKITPSSKVMPSSKVIPSSKIIPSSRITPPSSKIIPDSYITPPPESKIFLPPYYKETGKKSKSKKIVDYKYKGRESPIFLGAEKLFENTPNVFIRTTRKVLVKRTNAKPTKTQELDLGLEFSNNPLRTKSKKIIKNKNEFWSV